MKLNKYLIAFICSLTFFTAALSTLNDYGTSWDETLHFSRGHVYLNYFLTGQKEYSTVNTERKSFYQLDYQAGDFWFENTPGHPPLNGILAATFNYVFYQKLNWLGDIHSYQLFNITISTVLVFVVVMFALETIGIFGALVTFLALATYPLFFAEAHFNVKDPAETAMFAATIWTFYKSLEKKSWKWLLGSVIFFSLALGTKFNILFLPFVVIPYLIVRYWNYLKNPTLIKVPKRFWTVLLVSPLVVVLLFIGIWPLLWNNWPESILSVFSYYKDIGTTANYQPDFFYLNGLNTFPALWILFTTPPVTLGLFILGLISICFNLKLKNYVVVLWLLWFLIPVIRVTLPGTSIYGGVRQLMEYLPAMALIAGLGAVQLKKWLKVFKGWQVSLLIPCLFIWPIFMLVKIHPNQNVYFNFLIDGLKGAQKNNFPSWGNTYGNVYLQGIKWINEHAEPGAEVALIQGTETNTPKILFRPDIKLQNSYWSGTAREGEYLMEMVFNDTTKAFNYTWEYADKFLIPVFDYQVDGVTLLKIWKNDLEHTRPEYRKVEQVYSGGINLKSQGNELLVGLDEVVDLSKVNVKYVSSSNCQPVNGNFVETSVDGSTWTREADLISFTQLGNKSNVLDGEFNYYFASKKAKFIRFWLDKDQSCALRSPKLSINIFQ